MGIFNLLGWRRLGCRRRKLANRRIGNRINKMVERIGQFRVDP